MTPNDPLIAELAGANPVPRAARPGAQERAQADRVLERVLSSPPNKPRRGPIVLPIVSVLVVLAVVAVAFTLTGSTNRARPAARAAQLVLQAQPTPETPVITPAAMSRATDIVRERLDSVLHHFTIRAAANDELVVTAPGISSATRARVLRLATTQGELYFYDWEANALTPSGKTVASQLRAQDPSALTISQGSSAAAPGQPNAGGTPLYQAVKLAAKQAKWVSPHNTRLGRQYYMFGAPGSAACAAKAKQEGTVPTAGQHCLLAGPDNELDSTSYYHAVQNLAAQLPAGVTPADGEVLVVQQGTVVLQAANASASDQVKFSSPEAQFYVLHDDVALRGSDITNPQQSTDQGGNPAVTFGFNSTGNNAFQNVTGQIARRGQDVSTLGQTLDQHFAVALDDQLLTVPSIDFKQYPDGIIGGNGADITGGLTKQSAKDIATEFRSGALPVRLTTIG